MTKSGRNVYANIAVMAVAICGMVMLTFGIILNSLKPAHADAVTVNGGAEMLVFVYNGQGYTVVGTSEEWPSNDDYVNLTIPDEYNDGINGLLPVTAIGENAFINRDSLKSVTMGNDVTIIDKNAFYYCTSLESIKLSDNLEIISACAFYRCESLTSIAIPNTVTDIGSIVNALTMDDYDLIVDKQVGAFEGCYSLTSVKIPGSVTEIGDESFSGCRSLSSVEIGYGVKSIGAGAFIHCSFTEIEIPDSVETLYLGVFGDCPSLTKIIIPNSVTTMGDMAFLECVSLTDITIGSGINNLGMLSFGSCISLESIAIPTNIESIGSGAFMYCSSLKNVDIPNSVEKIDLLAFMSCTSLESISIPEGVESLGGWAFYDCSSLKSVVLPHSLITIQSGTFKALDADMFIEAELFSEDMADSLTFYVIGRDFAPAGWDADWNKYGATVVWNARTDFAVETPAMTNGLGSVTILEPVVPTGSTYTYVWYYTISGGMRVLIDNDTNVFEYEQKSYTVKYECEVYDSGDLTAPVFTVEKTIMGTGNPRTTGQSGNNNNNFETWLIIIGSTIVVLALAWLVLLAAKRRKEKESKGENK